MHGEGCVACAVVAPLVEQLQHNFDNLQPEDVPTACAMAISIMGTMARCSEYAEDILKHEGVTEFCRLLHAIPPSDKGATALINGLANLAANGDVRERLAQVIYLSFCTPIPSDPLSSFFFFFSVLFLFFSFLFFSF